MSRENLAGQDGFAIQKAPLVLAITSCTGQALQERLLMALAIGCARQGGRVLVIEAGAVGTHHEGRGELTAVEHIQGFPGEVMRGADDILYAGLESAVQADMFIALDVVTGTPPRFDLVLLNVRSDVAQEMFLASLAQRVVMITSPDADALPVVRSKMEWLADRHQQRHFTLVVDGQPEQARSFYRHLLGDSSELTQVECELLESLPEGIRGEDATLTKFFETSEHLALLETLWQDFFPLQPRGGLQLFWRCVMFCNDCSLKMCRELLASGKTLEVCPAQRF